MNKNACSLFFTETKFTHEEITFSTENFDDTDK